MVRHRPRGRDEAALELDCFTVALRQAAASWSTVAVSGESDPAPTAVISTSVSEPAQSPLYTMVTRSGFSLIGGTGTTSLTRILLGVPMVP